MTEAGTVHPSTRVLIIIENCPLQRDMRVRRQCRALLDQGHEVTVICPADEAPLPEELEPVSVLTWQAPPEPSSAMGFVREYLTAFLMVTWLSILARRRHGFDIIQACNPPDFFFVVAMAYRPLGVRFVFDHHDLSPELFTARFGHRPPILGRLLRTLERRSVQAADVVLATNESVRALDIERGGADPDDVVLVRNGPTLDRGLNVPPDPELRAGCRHLCVWHGHMGSVDDGLDLVLAAFHHLVHDRGRRDVRLALVGDGEIRTEMQALTKELQLDEWVEFPGWLDRPGVDRYLATADLGLAPDPKTPRLDLATSMKIMEFMAFALPVVAFDVHETQVSAGDAGVYVENNDPQEFAAAIDELLDDPDRRRAMGDVGRHRLETGLSWDQHRVVYLSAIDDISRRLRRRP